MKLLYIFSGVAASLLTTISVAMAQEKLDVFNTFDDNSETVVEHSDWGNFLGKFVRTQEDGLTVVDYGAVSEQDHDTLKTYLSDLQAKDPTTLNRDEAFVYWVNLYNALTVDIILDNYPLRSIRNIFSGIRPGPWQRQLATINGVKLSLDNIEHGILRKFWSDNRVHYAVNCASIGCPNLLDRPFTVVNLEEMLDAAARGYVNHPRGVRVENNRVIASSIYNWFQEDFGGNQSGVLEHLRQYANPETEEMLKNARKIHKFEYNWRLNDAE